MTFDSDTDPECRDLFINQATAEGIAKVQVDMIAEQIGDAGEIAILSASANATNQNAWIEMMEAELEANHPDIELVDTVYGDDDDQTSFDKTAALLQSHPDLKGIICPTTVGIAAAARYLSDSEYKGKVALTGLGTPNQMREYVEDGTVTAFALWNPGDLGYLAAYAAKALADGDITGEAGDTFEAGELGEFTVEDGRHRCSWATRSSSTPTTSATSTSESVTPALRPTRAAREPSRHHRTQPSGRTVDAARLLPAPGQAGPDGRVRASATRRCGRRCWPRCTRRGGTTTRCSCAGTAC